MIPKGVVHAYRNVGLVSGIVFNCPNRLYMGVDKKDEIDEHAKVREKGRVE